MLARIKETYFNKYDLSFRDTQNILRIFNHL